MRQQTQRNQSGFTLVEILVVIGIIVILAGILVPMIGRAMRQAKQTRTAADMQSIATALEAFKADHGDYPRVEPGARGSGAAVLGRFLFGPYGDATLPPPPPSAFDDKDPPVYVAGSYLPGDTVREGNTANDPTWVCVRATTTALPMLPLAAATPYDWAPIAANDGVDGPGLHHRPGGKKYGPYLQEGKFKLRGLAVLDGNDNPILYFPARPGKGGDLTGMGANPDHVYVYRSSIAGNKALMKYDADDNFDVFRRDTEPFADVLHRIRAMLGDYDGDGVVDTTAGEKIVTEAPYLLWAAGSDGKFGPEAGATEDTNILNVTDVDRCDDVVNFRE